MRKIILTVLAASLIIGSCTGCLKRKNDSTYTSEAINNVNTVAAETTDTPEISAWDFSYEGLLGSTKLVYDKNTKVIYIQSAYGGFTPYLSESGNYCRYVNGKIVDIEK